jgi:hypothetical protein
VAGVNARGEDHHWPDPALGGVAGNRTAKHAMTYREIADALGSLASAPRWVAWRNEWRGEGDARKLTKVPFGRDRRPAKADDPSTWLTREEASDLAKSIAHGLGGGIGIQLGDVGDGTYLTGFDLDSCLDEKQRLASWAAEIIKAASTYAETSPSGKGVKLFAFVAANDVRPFLASIGVSAPNWGTRRSVPGQDGANHGPAIEVYCGLRFFTVTNNRFGLLPEQPAQLDDAALQRLANLVPPTRCRGGSTRSGGADNSRSARAFGAGRALRRAGLTYEQMCNALRSHSDAVIRDWVIEKGDRGDGRGLRRIWDSLDDDAEKDTKGRKQADVLIELAAAAELFHTPDGIAFADVMVSGHRETWPVRSKGFRRWLDHRYYERTGGAPNKDATQSALGIIEAKAHYDAPERTAHMRVAELDEKLYLDLADAEWRVVELDTDGWRIISDPPVRFRRAAGMLPLPEPVCNGSLAELRRLINVRDEQDVVLITAWLLAGLRNRGPYPVLALTGEQGSAKSSLAALLRSLVDPNKAPLRTLPREDRDLFIAATNSHVIAIDNVSSLPSWLSDTLCRLSTGGGFATRQLYTDQDEVLLDVIRPIVLTGIEDVVTRGDLADRSILVRLDPISEEQRRPDREIWAQFAAMRPRILGALLDAMAHGLRHLPTTRLDRLPRMADFAVWVTACEGALWESGTFLSAYSGNRAEMDETVIEADAVAIAVRSLIADRSIWTGTAQELLAALVEIVGELTAKAKTWPRTPRALSGRLRRAAPNLRRVRISIIFGERSAKERPITITAGEKRIRPSRPSSPSSAKRIGGIGDDGRLTDDDTDATTVIDTVMRNSAKPRLDDGRDAGDDGMPPFSGTDQETVEWTV